jgi:DNA (cytosine-5)-methyltransferase 1
VPRAIDIFCGAGGLSLGLQNAGFEVVAALDFDAAAATTYRANLGNHLIEDSIYNVDPKDLLALAGMAPGECDLLAGGPPCQGFSVQRRGDDEDLRNHLVLRYLEFVEAIQPKFFLMENVRGLMSKRGKPYFNRLLNRSQELGYVVQVAKLNAADFGVPQERIRVVMVGERSSRNRGSFAFPEPQYKERDYRTVRATIGDLPTPPDDGSPHAEYPLHFREARLSATNIERFRHIPEGGGRDDLPHHLQLPCHVNNPAHRHKDVYGRMAWDRPAPTLTARFDSFSRGRFGHPVEHRTISLREGARLQTFPDDFHFSGNREEVARQIGNAVPPLLARVLGETILKCLEECADWPRACTQTSSGKQLRLFGVVG